MAAMRFGRCRVPMKYTSSASAEFPPRPSRRRARIGSAVGRPEAAGRAFDLSAAPSRKAESALRRRIPVKTSTGAKHHDKCCSGFPTRSPLHTLEKRRAIVSPARKLEKRRSENRVARRTACRVFFLRNPFARVDERTWLPVHAVFAGINRAMRRLTRSTPSVDGPWCESVILYIRPALHTARHAHFIFPPESIFHSLRFHRRVLPVMR